MKFGKALLLAVVSLGVCGRASTSLGRDVAPPGGKPMPGATPATTSWVAGGWSQDALGDVDAEVFALALQATQCAVQSGDLSTAPQTLTVIDYSKPSTAERLWVFDLSAQSLLYHELVAHGQGSGDNLATRFSNDAESHRSSLGLFVTEGTYVGKNGYSLRLNGLETGVNDRARERAIVMHGAPYVSSAFAEQQGRLGRSWGCPALRAPIARQVIDRVKGGSVVFAYYPDRDWLRSSKYLHGCA